MPEAKGVSPIFSRSSAGRRPEKAVLDAVGIIISSHDFAFRVDREDRRGAGRAPGTSTVV